MLVAAHADTAPEHLPWQLLELGEVIVQLAIGPLQCNLDAVLVDGALGALGRRLRALVARPGGRRRARGLETLGRQRLTALSAGYLAALKKKPGDVASFLVEKLCGEKDKAVLP